MRPWDRARGAGPSFDVRTVAVRGTTISIVVGISLGTDPEGLVVGLTPSTAMTTLKLQFLVFALTAYVVAAETNEDALASADVERRLATVEDLQGLLLQPRVMAGQGCRVRGVYDAAVHDVDRGSARSAGANVDRTDGHTTADSGRRHLLTTLAA